MRLYRQERSAGRIPQVPKQTSKPPTDGGGGGTTSPGNSQISSVHYHGSSSNIASTGSTSGTFKDPFLKQEGQSNWEYNIKVKGPMHDFVCVYVALQVGGSCFRSLNGVPNIGPKGGYGYVDVMKGNKYWEVKPEGTRPDKQMERYDKTGLKRGGAIQEMYLPYGYGLLHVTNGPRGVVWYEYLSTPEKYPEAVRAYETSQERVNYCLLYTSDAADDYS